MKVEHKIYWGVGILSVLLFAGSFLIPGERIGKEDLPWNIAHPTPDTVQIFGLTLGKSTTTEAEQHFREESIPSLFKTPEGKLVAEVFFEQVDLAGMRAKIVLTIAVPDAELDAMFQRGLRMSASASGKKITLATEDVDRLRTLPISSLTYLPPRVEDEVILKRFGPPAQRIREKKTGAIHLLYPQSGLDITLGGKEKPLLQYVEPKAFDKLVRPLLDEGEVLSR